MPKRSFDLIASAIGLIILSPLLVLIAIMVKLSSPGPVFYRGVRSGLHGMPFQIYKFRTMVQNAESLGGMSTAKHDARITPVGNVLRRYKLDELPQLLNVLKGDMSIVGPRPEMPAYTDLYEGEELAILSVRPGITDYASLAYFQLADVLGSEAPDQVYEEQVRPVKNALRVKYVREQSMRTDLVIILRTLRRLLTFA